MTITILHLVAMFLKSILFLQQKIAPNAFAIVENSPEVCFSRGAKPLQRFAMNLIDSEKYLNPSASVSPSERSHMPLRRVVNMMRNDAITSATQPWFSTLCDQVQCHRVQSKRKDCLHCYAWGIYRIKNVL